MHPGEGSLEPPVDEQARTCKDLGHVLRWGWKPREKRRGQYSRELSIPATRLHSGELPRPVTGTNLNT